MYRVVRSFFPLGHAIKPASLLDVSISNDRKLFYQSLFYGRPEIWHAPSRGISVWRKHGFELFRQQTCSGKNFLNDFRHPWNLVNIFVVHCSLSHCPSFPMWPLHLTSPWRPWGVSWTSGKTLYGLLGSPVWHPETRGLMVKERKL